MGYLKINKVIYSGKEYYYESPIFDDGINVIVGPNGSGKSTFIDLICYGLGCYVEHFNIKNSKIHEVICKDKENFIVLKLKIDDIEYTLKRYINSNDIFVTENSQIKEYPVNRKDKEQVIFSDWLLKKLNIEPVEIYNNIYSGIISFEELFRLIHYEQKSNQSKIYKEAKVDGNFVSDSLVRRNAIFEILMGKKLIKYYSSLNSFKAAEKKYGSDKGVFEVFNKSIKELYHYDIIERGSNQQEIKNIEKSISTLQDEMSLVSKKEYTNGDFLNELSELKDQITDLTFKLREKKEHYRKIVFELEKVNTFINDKEIEIKQLRKIVFTHQELNIFSPTTCPYCFNEVKREKNHCVCGNEVDEDYFEKSFYSMKEYLSMIKQKNSSLNTLNDARNEIFDEIKKCTKEISDIKNRLEEKQKLILNIKNDNVSNVNTTGIRRLNDEIVLLNSKLNLLREQENLYNKGITLNLQMIKSKEKFDSAKNNLQIEENNVQTKINDMITAFSDVYNIIMQEVLEGCENARIDENYMPVINNGVYINASADVQIKLVYFITLLWISLESEVDFPRLLIIDTPESLGIDKENLIKTLNVLTQLPNTKKYQIILTSGAGKYPKSDKFIVKETMTKKKELLKKC
jgi:DNA repair exonuclease SbcCD ATPase subunit